MLTLTQVARSDEPLQDAKKRFNLSVGKLLRSADWKRHVAGALIFREATYNRAESRWHVHAHILLQTPVYWDRNDIQALWKRFSPGAWNVDIRAAEPGVEAELAKYGTKSVDFETEQVLEFAVAMSGARLVTGTGEWKSALTDEELDDTSEELDEGEELYRLQDLLWLAKCGDTWAETVLQAVDNWIAHPQQRVHRTGPSGGGGVGFSRTPARPPTVPQNRPPAAPVSRTPPPYPSLGYGYPHLSAPYPSTP